MKKTKVLGAALLVMLAASVSFGDTAKQYRGPFGEEVDVLPAPPSMIVADFAPPGPANGQIEGLSRWEFWWEANRDRFLRQAMIANATRVVGDGILQIYAGPGSEFDRITPEEAKSKIVPVLIRRLESTDPEERAIAAVALGAARAGSALAPLRSMLVAGTRSDRRAAALALGFLGDQAAEKPLTDLVARTGVSPAERAYAALALGYMDSEGARLTLRKALTQSLSHEGAAIDEFQAAVATALGIQRDRGAVPLLTNVARTRTRRAKEVRAAAALALGRIGDGSALPALLAGIKDGQVEVRRASAQALGLLRQPAAKLALSELMSRDSDTTVRGLAAVALAEIGGTDVAPSLLAGLHRRSPRSVRGFSAVALGILGDRSQAKELRKVVEGRGEQSLRGAAAIGLGLMRDRASMPALRRITENAAADDELRGYAVIALAMMGDTVTRSFVRDHVGAKGFVDLRRSATLALGLYDDLPAGPAILGALTREPDPYVRGAAIASLASAPRKSVLDELVALADTRGLTAEARKDVVAALGVLARAGRPSPAEDVLSGVNYRSMSRAVEAVTLLF